MARKSNYSKGVYDQLLEDVMARLSVMETSHKEGQKKIKHLNSIVRQQEKFRWACTSRPVRLCSCFYQRLSLPFIAVEPVYIKHCPYCPVNCHGNPYPKHTHFQVSA